MSKIIKITTQPELNTNEYNKLLKLENGVDFTILTYPEILTDDVIKEELIILQYVHGQYGDGGWDFLQTVIFELADIINRNKEYVVIYILENVVKAKIESIRSALTTLRKRSSLKKFTIYIAQDKVHYSSFTVNSHVTDSEFNSALESLLRTFETKSNGEFVYDRQSKDWLEE